MFACGMLTGDAIVRKMQSRMRARDCSQRVWLSGAGQQHAGGRKRHCANSLTTGLASGRTRGSGIQHLLGLPLVCPPHAVEGACGGAELPLRDCEDVVLLLSERAATCDTKPQNSQKQKQRHRQYCKQGCSVRADHPRLASLLTTCSRSTTPDPCHVHLCMNARQRFGRTASTRQSSRSPAIFWSLITPCNDERKST